MSSTPGRISQIQLVLVPSTNQDRSLAFYEALGFERRNDIPWGDGYRWVEVYPPGGTAGIALVPPRQGDPTGVQTGIILNTGDVDAAHKEMQSRGVDVDWWARYPRCSGSATPTATRCFSSRPAEAVTCQP